MRHLDDIEIVDLIDGGLSPSRADHADDCDACRERVEAARRTLGEVGLDAGHEPSPLFWDHLAARVGDAVGQEPPARSVPAWTAWMRSPATAWATCASIAILLMVTALWRATLHAPVSEPAGVATAVPMADNVDADRAWAVVRTAADDLAWEDMTAVGIAARPGSVDRVVPDLTAAERAELARLIESELRGAGVS